VSLEFNADQVGAWVHHRLPKFRRQGGEYRGPCPIHQGKRDSFAVNSETGQAFCHSEFSRGWDLIALEQELTGSEFRDALASVESIVGRVNGHRDGLGRIVVTYNYTDEAGALRFQVVRFEPKDFRQRRPDGAGGWVWNLTGVQRIPYRLADVKAAASVYVAEGEKDVETLRRLGLVGTCNPEGAGKWRDDFAQYFAGKDVAIIPDADEPGRRHALQVAENLLKTARSIKVLELLHGNDVTEWGGGRDELLAIAAAAGTLNTESLAELRARWFPPTSGQQQVAPDRASSSGPQIRDVADIPSVLDCAAAEPRWVVKCWIVEGTINVFISEPGAGKTTVFTAVAGAVRCGAAFAGMETTKRPVLILDRENTAAFIADVLRRLRVRDGDGLRIWGGWLQEQAPDPGAAIVQGWVLSCDPKPLIIVDSLVAFHGGDQNDSTETRAYLHRCRRLADLGATVLLLHHSGKSETAQDYRGSSDIKASADACFKLTNIGPANCLERLRIKPFKSRFLVDSEIVLRYSDGIFTREAGGGSQRATDAELLEQLLKGNPGVTGKEFEKLAPGKGVGRNYARTWLDNRVKDGCVRVDHGAKNARLYTWEPGAGDDDDKPPF